MEMCLCVIHHSKRTSMERIRRIGTEWARSQRRASARTYSIATHAHTMRPTEHKRTQRERTKKWTKPIQCVDNCRVEMEEEKTLSATSGWKFLHLHFLPWSRSTDENLKSLRCTSGTRTDNNNNNSNGGQRQNNETIHLFHFENGQIEKKNTIMCFNCFLYKLMWAWVCVCAWARAASN